ncbi:hypothetical protein BV97_05175 [Novosphingobium resinovorum]|uniref:Uncharacterized protein n=1 Tax=Novosphingobium resinovorum TaxID=158500 RepID=A0A031JEX2_9SPHN|nr:hypothetical protein BV97_05175 [Novosphingobium resinovorum]
MNSSRSSFRTCPGIQYAKRTDREPCLIFKQCAGIESNAARRVDQGIGREPAVLRRIANFQEILLQNRVSAKGGIERGFSNAKTHFSLEPLSIISNEIDDCDRRRANRSGQFHNIIELLFARGIENIIFGKHRTAAR